MSQSTIEVNANAGNATVDTLPVADADTEVTVNVTPAENNYIQSVSLFADGGSKEWNTERYIDDGNYTEEITDVIGKELSSILNGDAIGEYKVVVQYAENRDYNEATQTAYFSVYDNRSTTLIRTHDAVMSEENLGNISYSSSELVDILIRSVSDGTRAILSKNDVKVTSIECVSAGYGPILKEAPLTELGVFEIYFEYPDTKTHKKSKEKASITIRDGRLTAVINLKSGVELPYTEANPLTEEGIYTAVFESVMVGKTNVDLAYDAENVSLIDKDGKSVEASAITELGTYTIKIKVEDANAYKGAEKTEEFKVIDGRNEPVLNLKQDANVAYKAKKYTEQELLDAVFESLTNANGVAIKTENMTATANADVLNVGSYEITVEFGGNADYKPASATTTLTVVKADQTAPSGLTGTAETIDQKADGKITGLTTAMEYRKDSETDYTAITGTELTERSCCFHE